MAIRAADAVPMRGDDATIRLATPGDVSAAYHVCLKTGDNGDDGEPHFADDPGALGRIFVGPYLAFEPHLSLMLEDADGVCGYALGALDSRRFYERYERDWRPALCEAFPLPPGDPSSWSRVDEVHGWYHHPDYFCPEPYDEYPSHLHIDLLPRAQGRGLGGRMITHLLELLREGGSPGVHLGVRPLNMRAYGFYRKLGFHELTRTGSGNDASVYMGLDLRS